MSDGFLSPKMKLFADEWLTGAETGKRFNGVAAYEYAGYNRNEANPSSNPSKLLRHPLVSEYVQGRMDEFAMSANEALLRFTAIARAEMGDILRLSPNGKELEIDPKMVLKMKGMIKSYGVDSQGNPKIEFHDALGALRDIARVRGMNKDGLELTGAGGAVNMTVRFIEPNGEPAKMEGLPEPEKPPEDFGEFDEE